jgi:hypothetical protein
MAFNTISERAISLPFAIGADGSINSTSSTEQIWSDRVTSAVMTRKGERIRRSQFGTSVGAVSLGTLGAAKDELSKEIADIFRVVLPPLTLIEVSADSREGSATLDLGISYRLPSQQELEDGGETLTLAGFAAVTDGGTSYEEIQ